MPFFGRIRFADLTLKPRLVEHTHALFFWDVSIRNSLRWNEESARTRGMDVDG